jgi:hypothetical protein
MASVLKNSPVPGCDLSECSACFRGHGLPIQQAGQVPSFCELSIPHGQFSANLQEVCKYRRSGSNRHAPFGAPDFDSERNAAFSSSWTLENLP